jgi:hypothetical protein
MHALALALLLLAEPAVEGDRLAVAAPAAPALAPAGVPVARPLVVPEFGEAAERPVRGQFRVTLGGGGVSGLPGVSPTVLVGLEVSPWRHVGVRAGMGMVAATGGGAWSSAELSAALVYHVAPGAAFDPYLAAGAQLGVLSIYRPAGNVQPISFATSTGEPITIPDSSSGRGPISGFAAPEVQAGVNTRLRGKLSLDVGVRYLPLTYKGVTRSAFTGLVTLCTPF